MILICPACATRFVVDPAAIGPDGRRVRCARCAQTWFQEVPAGTMTVAGPTPVAAPPPAAPPAAAARAAQAPAPPPKAELPRRAETPALPPPVEPPDGPPNGLIATPLRGPGGAPPLATEPMPSFIGARTRLDAAQLPVLRPPERRFAVTTVQLGWAALGAFVVLFLTLLISLSDSIAAVWPATEQLYDLIGVKVTAQLRLTEPKATYRVVEGQQHLVISGQIENLSSGARSVPPLHVTLLDVKNASLASWEFRPASDPLKPGQILPYQTENASPPPNVASVDVVFAGR
jgi:predicted Zn finger-like uncharacterized protein